MSNKPKLTIGFATYKDARRLIFSIQDIRANNQDLLHRIRFIIVDNCPDSNDSVAIKELFGWLGVGSSYIPYTDIVGTAAPRNLVFEAAQTEWVMCMDSHVILVPSREALHALFEHIDSNPESNDLLSGPILKDDMTVMATHFDQTWRSHMWGTWQLDPRGIDPSNPPFEIPAMGLGLFCCRKDMWKKVGGFNPKFRGFGGEENYIHKKFYRAGARCLCLPKLKWWHDFHKVRNETGQTIQYPGASVWNACRNYVIGHDELGLPFDNIQKCFVDTPENNVPIQEYLQLIASPNNPPELPKGYTHDFVNKHQGNREAPTPEGLIEQGKDSTIQWMDPKREMGRITIMRKRNVVPDSVQSQPVEQPVQPPGLLTKVWNVAGALVDFVSDGLTLVNKETYEARLAICDTCPQRQEGYCGACGCNLAIKAKARVMECPLNKWKDVEAKLQSTPQSTGV